MAYSRNIPAMKKIAALAAVFALIGYAGAFEYSHRDNFFPGVSVAGVPTGGKTYEEVRKYFEVKAGELAKNGLELELAGKNGTRSIKIPIESTGLTADNIVEYFTLGDWEETVQRAYDFGRNGFWRGAAGQLMLLAFKKNFDFPAAAREGAVSSLLARESRKFLKAGQPAQFVSDGDAVSIAKEVGGEKLDPEEIIKKINSNLASFNGDPIRVEAEYEIPAVTAEKLAVFSDFAGKLARSANLIFYYNDYRWRVSGNRLITWLAPKGEKGIGVDVAKLEDFLSKTVAPVIDDPPRNSRFEMRYGKLVEIVPGKSGNAVDVEKTAARVDQIVFAAQRSFAGSRNLLLALSSAGSQIGADFKGGNMEIPLEVIRSEPKISRKTIDQYEIRDLVGLSVTSFKGSSADRRKNIETGVSKLNGLLIAPGEEFSAVEGIGVTSEEEGFVKEYVIKEDRSVKELGGGLCQLATTLFRSALNAGFPITERMNHRYVVGYYGPGLDATIYGPKPDLKFVNDTGGYLLLQGKVAGDELTFEFYGQKDGRRVEISEPVISDEIPAPETRYVTTPDLKLGEFQCSETPRKGVTADVVYKVFYPDGQLNEQNFHSIYQPWAKVCLIGIK